MKKILVFIAAALILSGCNEIKHNVKTETKTDAILTAGVGDTILKIERQRNLTNAFGKADIFGRKTTEGYIEVVFAGVERNGDIVLYRKDTKILTNETTLSASRNPFSTTTGYADHSFSGTVNGSSVSGIGSSTYNATSMSPTSDYHIVVPSNAIALRLPSGTKQLPVLGHYIQVISANPLQINYKVTLEPSLNTSPSTAGTPYDNYKQCVMNVQSSGKTYDTCMSSGIPHWIAEMTLTQKLNPNKMTDEQVQACMDSFDKQQKCFYALIKDTEKLDSSASQKLANTYQDYEEAIGKVLSKEISVGEFNKRIFEIDQLSQ